MTKPTSGKCGTCHWFEPSSGQVNGERQGTCCVNPPTPFAVMQQAPGSSLRPGGPVQQPAAMGMRPPTGGNARCEKWTTKGSFPPLGSISHAAQ